MDWIMPLIGGLGIGSVLSRAADYFLTRHSQLNERAYQEMKEAYLGLLGALHQAAIAASQENSKNYALWQTRCELFGSNDVARAAQRMVDTNDGPHADRVAAHRALIEAMRIDLRKQ